MTDDQGSPQDTRRGQDRKTVLKGAKVVFNNGKGLLVCRVRDLSPDGARLEFASRQMLPRTFDLQMQNGAIYRCEVRWAKDNFFGVRFLDDNE